MLTSIEIPLGSLAISQKLTAELSPANLQSGYSFLALSLFDFRGLDEDDHRHFTLCQQATTSSAPSESEMHSKFGATMPWSITQLTLSCLTTFWLIWESKMVLRKLKEFDDIPNSRVLRMTELRIDGHTRHTTHTLCNGSASHLHCNSIVLTLLKPHLQEMLPYQQEHFCHQCLREHPDLRVAVQYQITIRSDHHCSRVWRLSLTVSCISETQNDANL